MEQNFNKHVVAINEVDFGSTGSVAINFLNKLKEEGFQTLLVCHESKQKFDNEYIINKNKFVYLKNKILSRIDASDGFHSKGETKKLVKYLCGIKPACLFLNNLHGSYINLPILFDYIKREKVNCIWTLHDCWSFTGKCAHFSNANCNKWKTQCHNCPMLHSHPRSYLFDRTKKLFLKKKKLFEGLENYITFVCPSKWLDDFLADSYLKNFKHTIIRNGIDINAFSYVKHTKFREVNNLGDKKLILCCANIFDESKGINDILKLSKLLENNEKIILVGKLKHHIELPDNIMHIEQINDIEMLREIYSSSNVFFNPTHDDNYPTVNLESLACDLPVISYKTGGISEIIDKKYLVDIGDINTAYNLIKRALDKKEKNNNLNKYDISLDKMQKEYLLLFKEKTSK